MRSLKKVLSIKHMHCKSPSMSRKQTLTHKSKIIQSIYMNTEQKKNINHCIKKTLLTCKPARWTVLLIAH